MYRLQGMLPPEAQDHERVRAQLTWALNAMNNSMLDVPLQYAQPQLQPAVGAGYAYAGAAGVWLSLSLAIMHALAACCLHAALSCNEAPEGRANATA